MPNKNLSYYMELPYKIELLPEEGEVSFTAVIPKLKGCMAFGETPAQAIEMLNEAKSLWLETALEKGWPIPEPEQEARSYSGRFNVRLPQYLHRELVELAEQEGTSLNQLVVALLSQGAELVSQHRTPVEKAVPETIAL
jgi:predicted RNase H-like HicB family nuclease